MKKLLERLDPTEYMGYYETLSKIKKIGSLRGYQKEFEYLSTRVHEWSEKILIGSFVGGLNIKLTAEAKFRKPKTLIQVLKITWIKEDQLQDLKKNSHLEERKSSPMVFKFSTN